MTITPLPHGCNSWIVTRKDDGSVIGEFYDGQIVSRFNPETTNVQSALDYLQGLNKTQEKNNL